MNGKHDVADGPQAVIDLLLAEALAPGAARDGEADLAAAVLRRFADGEAAAVAARLAHGDGNLALGSAPTTRWRQQWLVAAIVLLAVGVLFAVAWSRREPERRMAGEPTQDPAPAPQGAVPVGSLDELRALLPQVAHVELEVLYLAEPDLPRIELGDVAVTATPQATADLFGALRDDARVEQPASRERQNSLRFVLRSGQHVALDVDPNPSTGRVTIGLGAAGDLSIGGAGAHALRELLATAVRVACVAHGVVRSVTDLNGPDGLPEESEVLRLFGVAEADLEHLTRFRRLRHLDCRGIAPRMTRTGLRHIARCGGIEELSLAGMTLHDDDLFTLMPLTHLLRLDLRGVREFTGVGFDAYVLSARVHDGPSLVDLRDVPTLSDDGIQRVVACGVAELRVAGSGAGIGANGWSALLRSDRLAVLDLGGWALDDQRLAALAATKAPLRKLSLRDVRGISIAGLAAVAAIPTLAEIDVRGVPGIDLEASPDAAIHRAGLTWTR